MRAILRRDAVEDETRGFDLAVAPVRAARGDKIGLRAQHDAVVDDFQRIGGKRRAGGRDVDDHLGGAGRRCAFGRAEAFHDPVIGDAMRREEGARQVHIFGRDPHLAVMPQPERGRDVVEIGHAAHVDPGLRHGDHDIGETETETFQQDHAAVGLRDHLAHEVFAGDAEMRLTGRELCGDLAGGKISHLDRVEACDGAAIFARAARLHERQTCAREEVFRILLQAAFGRHRDDERRAHRTIPISASRSIQAEKPTAGIVCSAPRRCSMPSYRPPATSGPDTRASCNSNTKPV